MSAPEHVQETDAIGSRVKITMGAGREARPEVSVREGTTEDEVNRITDLALAKFCELEAALANRRTP